MIIRNFKIIYLYTTLIVSKKFLFYYFVIYYFVFFNKLKTTWEQHKLGAVAAVFDGTHQTPKYKSSGVKFVSVENIKDLSSDKYISEQDFIKEYSNKLPEKGDVLMTRIGDIGTTKLVGNNEPLAYYVTLALIKPKNISGEFLVHLISSNGVQKELWKRTLHIAFPKKINLGEITDVKISISSLSEQNLIGSYFNKFDNLITLHQRNIFYISPDIDLITKSIS